MLVGDYVYSRSFEMMVSLESMRIMDVMAGATNKIAEGEVLQLLNAKEPDTTEEQYFEVIYRKTAKLFEAGAQVAGILAGVSAETERAVAAYGRHLGTAFQLVDDVLDRDLPRLVGRAGAERREVVHRLRAGVLQDHLVGGRHIDIPGIGGRQKDDSVGPVEPLREDLRF